MIDEFILNLSRCKYAFRSEPQFWWMSSPTLLSRALLLPEYLYRVISWIHSSHKKHASVRAPYPVISIGNLVVGGAGKTPCTLALARLLAAEGYVPWAITRGYGGRCAGPLYVIPNQHTPRDVGEEALLLAREMPTIVSRVRKEALRLIPKDMRVVILLDDGHQHMSLYKDISFVVVNGRQGFGNTRTLPAGPLRESIPRGLARCDAVLWVGPSEYKNASIPAGMPIIHMQPVASCPLPPSTPVIGFCGIGHPSGFRETLVSLGLCISSFRVFPDHHFYMDRDERELLQLSERTGASLVTTQKDAIKLSPGFRTHISCVEYNLVFLDPHTITSMCLRGF